MFGFLCSLVLALLSSLIAAQRCQPAIALDNKPQIFVMTDISNEPDDQMSMVRLLLHADQYNITGIVAITSYWLNDTVYPEDIQTVVRGYGQVVDNLNAHSEGKFPTKEYLSSIVKSGPTVYGTAGINLPTLSSGSQRLIDVVDGMPDDELLFCSAWGGTNMFAETLLHVRSTRPQLEIDRFIGKLRLYGISDQDNAGPWIRLNFPSIPYIVSLHGYNQYGLATWSGISGEELYNFDIGGPDSSLVTQQYIGEHFQRGPLGSLYSDIAYIMEGDSPAFTMMNGLNGGPYDHPEWGGWGGRYILHDLSRQTMIYSDARDNVTGMDGQWWTTNHASIWRWRRAYQEEMSARVAWSLSPEGGSSVPVVGVNGSCDSAPLMFDVAPEEEVVLDASASYDTISDSTAGLNITWFQYKEPTREPSGTNAADVAALNFTLSGPQDSITTVRMPSREEACSRPQATQRLQQGVETVCDQYHVILEVTGTGEMPIRRYKRVILKVQPSIDGSMERKRDEL